MESVRNFMLYLRQNPKLGVGVAVGLSYLAYYLLHVVKQPKVASNPKLKKFLLQYCTSVGQKFWPALWCIETRAQTIVRALFKSSPPIPYAREILMTSDGGQIALDWVYPQPKTGFTDTNQPTVILLPGLTGSSDESYVRHLAKQVLQLGYRLVVFNNRGNGGVKLLTPRTYNACNIDDMKFVVDHVTARFPEAPLFGTGISLGGIILVNYLAELGDDCKMVGAMACCTPFEIFECSKTLEKPINYYVFNKHLTGNLRRNLSQYKDMFKDLIDVDRAMESSSIREYDEHVTSKLFGYPTHVEYYKDASTHEKLRHVKVPLLCLNAEDDPFSPAHALPYEEVESSQNVVMVVTSRGGHIGFVDSIMPWKENFMDRVFAQWVEAVFTHGHELSDRPTDGDETTDDLTVDDLTADGLTTKH